MGVQVPIGHRITAIEGVPGLWAMEIDSGRAAQEYIDRAMAPVRSVPRADGPRDGRADERALHHGGRRLRPLHRVSWSLWVPETVSPHATWENLWIRPPTPCLAHTPPGIRVLGSAGTSQVLPSPTPRRLLLGSVSRYISCTTSRDHKSRPASWPTPGAIAIHFRFSGLDLSGFGARSVLARTRRYKLVATILIWYPS
jgi:hypothetical protein